MASNRPPPVFRVKLDLLLVQMQRLELGGMWNYERLNLKSPSLIS